MAILMCTVVASMALSLMATAVSRTTRVAVIVLPVLLELTRLFSGFYTLPNAASPGWKWINYLSVSSAASLSCQSKQKTSTQPITHQQLPN